MNLFNQAFSKSQVLKRVGDISAIAQVQRFSQEQGMGAGMHVAQVHNPQGLEFTVLLDRGMDIGCCDFQGIPLAYVSKTGFTSPFLCEHRGTEFLRNFGAGLLTTCGYTHFGSPCSNGEEEFSLHGRATGLLADQVAAYGEWSGDDYVMTIRGELRQSRVFGENICLLRRITVKAGENRLLIEDRYENCGFQPHPFMILYHCNFGYPMVSEFTSLLTCGSERILPRNEHSREEIASCTHFTQPIHGYEETVYYHDLIPENGSVWAGLYNDQLELGAYIRYPKEQLPVFAQWKMTGEGEYVCGLEAGTWYCEGQAEARKRKELAFLQPGEQKFFSLEIGMLTGKTPPNPGK